VFETVRTGASKGDPVMRVMFDNIRCDMVQQLDVLGASFGLERSQGADQGQGRELHNAIRGQEGSGGSTGSIPGEAWKDLKVSQEKGPMDMIIGRDNPEWLPFPVREELY
jgi:hypothetical protein